MNILYLMSGPPRSGQSDNNYPIPLIEVNGTPLIEKQIQKCSAIPNSQMIFAIKNEDNAKFHLDHIIKLVEPSARFVIVNKQTKGAACTALLAVSEISNDSPLLILNIDEYLKIDFAKAIKFFEDKDLDAGTIVFNSIHPRYSFVQLDSNDFILEVAEKKPISRFATAGFYYFKKGSYFIEAAQGMIRKDASIDGNFYISPVFNELILSMKKVGALRIDNNQYLPIKSEAQLIHFMNSMEKEESDEN